MQQSSTFAKVVRLISIFVFFLCPSVVRAEGDVEKWERETLRGIKSVMVSVWFDSKEAPKDFSIDNSILQTETELRLRKAGLNVVPIDSNDFKNMSDGTFQLEVYTTDLSRDTKAVNIQVLLWQPVTLTRSRQHSLGVTWKRTIVGAYPITKGQELKEKLGDVTDVFANDWLAANPNRKIGNKSK